MTFNRIETEYRMPREEFLRNCRESSQKSVDDNDIWQKPVDETGKDRHKLDRYYIWSNEHVAWWAPKHKGYVQDLDRAGLYSIDDAVKICNGANFDPTKLPDELPISEEIASKLRNL